MRDSCQAFFGYTRPLSDGRSVTVSLSVNNVTNERVLFPAADIAALAANGI